MASDAPSVIVRTRNSDGTIERNLESLRRQTVRCEIVVVDSGSTDRTLEIARRLADRVVEMPPEEFTFGRALNIGAREATGEFHFALSSHCLPGSPDWLELSLEHYRRADVAGTSGSRTRPDGRPLEEAVYQQLSEARAHPEWGYSNHAASWRADVWARFPFDERLPACEDREWAFRVMEAGWVIAVDPRLWVDMSHAWRNAREAYRRGRLEAPALDSFSDVGPYGVRELAREWWNGVPDHRRSRLFHRLNYRRAMRLVGKYRGLRELRAARA